MVKGKGLIILPDNAKEPISYDEIQLQEFFGDNSELMYHGLTASCGWEWFDSVRSEERFQKYIECARELMQRFSHATN